MSLVVVSSEELAVNLSHSPGPAVDVFLRRLTPLARGVADLRPPFPRQYLAGEGVQLWDQLVPEKVRQLFWERQSRIEQLTILSNRDIVPWELLYPKDGRRDAGFLVEQFPVTRAIFNHRRSERLRLRPAHFVLRPEPPSSARTEVDRVAALLGVEPATTSELVALLNLIDRGEFGLLHFSCHGNFSREEGSSIMLDSPFTPAFLSPAANAGLLAHASPMVFINSCSSLSEAPSYSELDGWARKFMNAGAAACIGSLWDVSDKAASSFAQEFYGRLVMGDSLGEAVMAARRAVAADSGDPTWLAYSVYGNPRAKISSSTSLVRG